MSAKVCDTNCAKVLTLAKAKLACLAALGKFSVEGEKKNPTHTSHFRDLFQQTQHRRPLAVYGRLEMSTSPELDSMTASSA